MWVRFVSSLGFLSLILGGALVVGTSYAADSEEPFSGSVYDEVWSTVKATPYTTLPSYSVTNASFYKGRNWVMAGVNQLFKDAKRTLSDEADLLPSFQKLVHPIGVCFAGTWTITEKNDYTGYFAQGSRALIIVRASEAMGQPLNTGLRALGLAGKIFPTADPKDSKPCVTANFFTVDDLGGVKADSYLDLAKTNAPPLSKHLSTFFGLPMLITITDSFRSADKNPGERQLYPIAELGLEDVGSAVVPQRMSLLAENIERPGQADFRDELRLANFNGALRFSISVGTKEAVTKIGTIELTDEALTSECDHELHFHHPKWRE